MYNVELYVRLKMYNNLCITIPRCKYSTHLSFNGE